MANDLIKNPQKTVAAAGAKAITVLSEGRCNMKAITNTIADVKTTVGIQYVTALEGPSTPDLIPAQGYRL